MADIRAVCAYASGSDSDRNKAELYALIHDDDDRVGYNALWIMTHFAPDSMSWLYIRRDELIDRVLTEEHTGKRRLILTLLERMPVSAADVRTDYLDFCLAHINSIDPYGVRVLCMKQAYAQCQWFPELLAEFISTVNMLDGGEISAGLRAARKNILAAIADGARKKHHVKQNQA